VFFRGQEGAGRGVGFDGRVSSLELGKSCRHLVGEDTMRVGS
jgi:hypothetical protein